MPYVQSKISCKRTIIFIVGQVMSDYQPLYDLGSHNILLETTYDLWARNEFLGPLPMSCELTGRTLKTGPKWILGMYAQKGNFLSFHIYIYIYIYILLV